jgi:hypothetical protein
MKRSRLSWSRLIVGIVLVAMAVLIFLFTDYATAGAIAIGVLGLVSIAISRRK